MKILRFCVAALCAVALTGAMTSCSDNDDNEVIGGVLPGDDEEDDELHPTEGIEVTAMYYGDYNHNNTGNFGINFLTAGMEWDDFDETYYGPGELVYMEINSALCENPDRATLKAGNYTFDSDETYAEMTFGSVSISQYTADGDETSYAVTGGTLKVEIADNGMYVLTGKFNIGTGTDYDFSYTGFISFVNRTDEGFMSNLTDNVVLEGLSQSAVIYWGETFTETSDYCSVIIAGDDYDLDMNIGKSPALNLGLNLTPGSTSIPAGTYTIINANEADDYDAFTALSGVYEATYGGYFGTWYFAGQIEASMYTGTVEVTDNGDGKYTFDINLADGYGHTVTGTYTGAPKIME